MDRTADRPSFIVDTAALEEQQERSPDRKERFSFVRPVGMTAGLLRLRLDLERLPPGVRLDWPHALESEEEFVLVQEGEVDAWIDGELYPMRVGDFAAFPAGVGVCHTFVNNGDEDALLLVGGERRQPNGRIFYPLNAAFDQVSFSRSEEWETAPVREFGTASAKARTPALAATFKGIKSGLTACKNNSQRTRAF